MKEVAILGSGSFGCAIAYQLSLNPNNIVTIFGRSQRQVDDINKRHINRKYFSNLSFNNRVKAESNYSLLKEFNTVFLAVPSSAICDLQEIFSTHIKKGALIIILTKGLAGSGITIYDYLQSEFEFTNIVSLKGPSFSVELTKNLDTLMTLGYHSFDQTEKINKIIENTNLLLDYTTDIQGVEYSSALKNIYAIAMGFVDGKYNSFNTRYFLLNKSFQEIRIILTHLRCHSATANLGCGIGDLSLTSLSELSRNRALGLLIGKGFYYPKGINQMPIVLEGVKTLNHLDKILSPEVIEKLPILRALIDFLVKGQTNELKIDFQKLINNELKTVLTYGTFDLLHYGHIEILKKAKGLGNRLIVGLSTDEFNLNKGKKCQFTYEKRKEYLESFDYVDMVIPERNWEQKLSDIRKYKVDTFVMGDDWKGKFDFLSEYCKVIYFPRTEGISTTQIKKIINNKKF